MRRDVGRKKWKPVGIVFILALSVFVGIFGHFGTNTATGTVVGGHITVDTTWNIAGSPYIAVGNVIVDPGATLIIEPGVLVEFDSPLPVFRFFHLFVEGELNATGLEGNVITFTSLKPGPFDLWGAIQINSTGRAEIRYCYIDRSDSGIIIASSSRVNVTHSEIVDAWGVLQPVGPQTPGHYFANNTFTRTVLTLSSSNNTVVNNMLEWGMAIYDGDGNLVMRNMMPGNGGIYMEYSHDNSILGNLITDSPGRGFEIKFSNYNVIADNVFRNIASYGIHLYQPGVGNIISRNAVYGAKDGIDCGGSSGVIENNTLEDISGTGMTIRGDDNSIVSNRFVNNRVGMTLVGADSLEIFLNDFAGSSHVALWSIQDNDVSIFHNSFDNNAIQAWDDNVTGRLWDASYPFGGNYWSDYNGSDFLSGPSQNIPGSDGVGDTPYLINVSSRDRYPLMERATLSLPPRNLNSHLTGTDHENVTLTWNFSWNDGQRANDVIGYEIYRSSTYDKERIGYSLISSTPNQTTQYMDIYSGEGDPNNYFYYVCAINGTGNSSCSSDQASKFTRPLSKGPNLISIPLIQSDETIQTVLQTVSYDNAWSYDPINQEWRSFSKSKPYGQSLEYLNHTMGIWVNVTQDSNITVAGVVPASTSINLQAGWNLVGFLSFDDIYTVADLKAAVVVERIEGFDGSAPPYFLKVMSDGDLLQAGFGYWIRVGSETSWTIGNS